MKSAGVRGRSSHFPRVVHFNTSPNPQMQNPDLPRLKKGALMRRSLHIMMILTLFLSRSGVSIRWDGNKTFASIVGADPTETGWD